MKPKLLPLTLVGSAFAFALVLSVPSARADDAAAQPPASGSPSATAGSDSAQPGNTDAPKPKKHHKKKHKKADADAAPTTDAGSAPANSGK